MESTAIYHILAVSLLTFTLLKIYVYIQCGLLIKIASISTGQIHMSSRVIFAELQEATALTISHVSQCDIPSWWIECLKRHMLNSDEDIIPFPDLQILGSKSESACRRSSTNSEHDSEIEWNQMRTLQWQFSTELRRYITDFTTDIIHDSHTGNSSAVQRTSEKRLRTHDLKWLIRNHIPTTPKWWKIIFQLLLPCQKI